MVNAERNDFKTKLKACFNFFTEPLSEKVKNDYVSNNKIRFLSLFLLIGFILNVLLSIGYFISTMDAVVIFAAVLTFSLIELGLYFYCRLGYYVNTTIIMVIMASLLTYSSMFLNQDNFIHYCYLITLTSLFLTIIAPAYVILLNFLLHSLAIFIVYSFLSVKVSPNSLGMFYMFFSLINGLLIIFQMQRDRLEKDSSSRLTEALDATIFALAYEAELRDVDTGKHLERTSLYVKLLSEKLKKHQKYKDYINERYINDLKKASLLHDIGKVGVPDAILLKPGKLSPEEFNLVKKHCEYGATILEEAEKRTAFESFFNIAIQIVRSHHERWDGNGYPNQLKGEDIPLSARIMSLSDVYDALRTKRCYKPAFDHKHCVDIILSEKGKHFDPLLVDCFSDSEQEFYKVSLEHK